MSEKNLQQKIVRKLKLLYRAATYKFESPGNAGVPDLISIVPREQPCPCCGTKADVVFIEVKNPNGKGRLSALQRAQIKRLEDAGANVTTTDDLTDTIRFVGRTTGRD